MRRRLKKYAPLNFCHGKVCSSSATIAVLPRDFHLFSTRRNGEVGTHAFLSSGHPDDCWNHDLSHRAEVRADASEPGVFPGDQLPNRVGGHVAAASALPITVGWALEHPGINWASAAVGVSIVGVELAVLLAYRNGWRVSLLSVIGNTASALLLVGIGLVVFHEHLSVRNVTGIGLCLVGLALITRH